MGGWSPEQEVLEKSGRRCCLCFGLDGDLRCKRGQIAHLDRNKHNNAAENLAFLCLPHHDQYDTSTSQSKGWTIKEAKRYRARLYREIEELRNNPRKSRTPIIPQPELPIFGQILSVSTLEMDAVDKNTGQLHSGVSAFPLTYRFHITFDVINPNRLDLRISRLYVDVLKFIDVDIIGVWEGALGGGMMMREYGCEIEPEIGRYDCHQISEGYDYIRLSSGEMEAFRINVEAVKEGIYELRLGMEYSIGGETKTLEADADVLEVGVFDSVFHEPSCDGYERVIEAPDSVSATLSTPHAPSSNRNQPN